MSATFVEKQVPVIAPAIKSSVGLRFAAGLIPAALLVGVYCDFAHSVTVGDAIAPVIETAASTSARLPDQSRDAVAGDLASLLAARKDLANVHVETISNPDRSVTIHVTADVPARFAPFIAGSFAIQRSVTAPAASIGF